MAIKISGNTVIDDNQNIISSGIATATNFKTGTTDVHSLGIEVAGINVLGGDTPIGSNATIYDNGNVTVAGNVTASAFLGDGSNLTGLFSGSYTDLSNKPDLSQYITNSGGTTGATANTVVKRDSGADIHCRLLRPNYTNQSNISGAIAFRINNSSDNYVRFCSDTAAIRTFLNVPTRTGGNASGTWGINITGNAATSTSASSCSGNAASASTVTINYHNNSNSTYQMLWGSGNSVYGTGGIYCNPYSNRIYSASIQVSDWLRTTGSSGWYSETYGGGMNMQDTTWVRVYNSKPLYVSNQIAATGNVTAYYSDIRLKEKLGDITNALDKVCSIDTLLYKHNDLAKSYGYEGDRQQIGVSAQSVKKVCPEVIDRAPFDIETHETDGTQTSKSGEDYMTVNYGRLVPLLIESIKELKAEVETLKQERN